MLPKQLRFETLESRHLLTAVVTETDGVVTIQGDDTAEAIVITQSATGQFEISGDVEDDMAGPGPFVFANITGFDIDLAGGADSLTFDGNGKFGLLADVDLNLGVGADTASLSSLRLDGSLAVTGEATDLLDAVTLTLEGVRVRGASIVQTGAGDDVATLSNSRLKGGLTGTTGDGTDQVTLQANSRVRIALALDFAAGDDEVAILDSLLKGQVDLSDASLIQLTNVRLDQAFNVQGSAGTDQIILTNINAFGDVTIGTSNGKDDVTIQDSRLRAGVTIDLDNSPDTLALVNSRFDGSVQLDGGLGKDNLTQSTSQFNGALAVQGFEEDDLA